MRNLLRYPITTEEIVSTLTRLRDEAQREIEEKGIIGSVEALVLDAAIERIKAEVKPAALAACL